jgi:hypothetical protein
MSTQEHDRTQAPASKQLESEGTSFMSPPQFSLTAGGADGGGPKKGKLEAPHHHGFEGTPYEKDVATWPGEVVMIHSPCYSQEIEALAMSAQGHSEQYESASAEMTAKIEECKGRKFQNAAGQENTWADSKLNGTVRMNSENWAATSNGKTGWPKLVILTFWNDPSNPESGGYNYSHILFFPFEELVPRVIADQLPGGMILCGDGGGGRKDILGHKAKTAEINEWMPILADLLGKLAGMAPNPKALSKELPELLQKLQKLAEDAERITSKAREMNKANNENEAEKSAEKKFDHEKYVEINGEKLERKLRYDVSFELDGIPHHGEKTPAEFLKEYGVQYEMGNCKKLIFRTL